MTGYSDVLGDAAAMEVLRRYNRLDLAIEIANGSDFDNRLTRLSESLKVATGEVLEGISITENSLTLTQAILREARNLDSLIRTNFADVGDLER
ncbi:hypothetical protein ASG49_13740 [Marmoricola sp. Leaf446]|nr:hypothetical protein ASG49_13740 [Marmoricola sp. Leaf446]